MPNQFTIRLGSIGQRREAADKVGGILPGMLVALNADAVDNVVVHPTAGGAALPAFAMEDDIQGNTTTDAYVITEVVQYETFKTGDRVLGRLASGQNVAKRAVLTSNGDGYLKAAGATDAIVGYAAEAVDASAAAAFIAIEIK